MPCAWILRASALPRPLSRNRIPLLRRSLLRDPMTYYYCNLDDGGNGSGCVRWAVVVAAFVAVVVAVVGSRPTDHSKRSIQVFLPHHLLLHIHSHPLQIRDRPAHARVFAHVLYVARVTGTRR